MFMKLCIAWQFHESRTDNHGYVNLIVKSNYETGAIHWTSCYYAGIMHDASSCLLCPTLTVINGTSLPMNVTKAITSVYSYMLTYHNYIAYYLW